MMRRSGFALGAAAEGGESVNPLEAVANLSDVMLVLAVALMLALITRMNVDFASLSDEPQLVPVEADVQGGTFAEDEGATDFEEVGTVYRDRETGDLYVLES